MCFRVDEPPMKVDMEAELMNLQASIKQLRTENLGEMIILHFFPIY